VLVAAAAVQALCAQLDLPLLKVCRNVLFAGSTPPAVVPKYSCAAGEIASKVTVVVTVKDACSQMPGFLERLREVVGGETPLIVTYPRFRACDPVAALGVEPSLWRNASFVALEPHSSPMVGWLDSALEGRVRTEYALLLHNDGYALDDFFVCELLKALEERRDANYVVAAPMLYESKADGSLAAHATQSRLRLSGDGVVRHDHSVARALNRGFDYAEGDQEDFLEDHGFLIETASIPHVIDPSASYTLEYVDMILSLKSRGEKVVFVPTARLEFRIAEFSWRDVPYFMYKRSEATCHGTRDYLARKWRAKFPNTGFWQYIKLTIVESHEYPSRELAALPWGQHAALALGFFQMAGYNRYRLGGSSRAEDRVYVDLLEALDDGSLRSLGATVVATREHARQPPAHVRNATSADALLPVVPASRFGWPSLEADMPFEYLPFAVAHLRFDGRSCADALAGSSDDDAVAAAPTNGTVGGPTLFPKALCGLAVDHASSCDCWVNLPTFKAHSGLMALLARLAAVLKVPSRVTTYLEMALGSTNPAEAHVAPLRALGAPHLRVATCGGAKTADAPLEEPCAPLDFAFGDASRVFHFSGRPVRPDELVEALAAA